MVNVVIFDDGEPLWQQLTDDVFICNNPERYNNKEIPKISFVKDCVEIITNQELDAVNWRAVNLSTCKSVPLKINNKTMDEMLNNLRESLFGDLL